MKNCLPRTAFLSHGGTPRRAAKLEFQGQEWLLEKVASKLGYKGQVQGGSEKPGKLEVGGASRDSTGIGALAEGLICS